MSETLFVPGALLVAGAVRPDWALVARDGRIAAAGPAAALGASFPAAERERLPGMLVVPGTVNAHSHSFQSLLRGLGDDQPFTVWRDYLYRFTPRLDAEGVHTAALFAFGEMLLRGVTTVCDFFYLHHGGNERALAVAQAARDVGIRLVLARAMMDWETAPAAFRETPAGAVANARALAAQLQGDRRVSVIPAPHSPHAASADMLRAGARLAAEWDTPWHIHVAEAVYEGEATRARYGLGPLGWIEAALGGLDERLRIVHGVWLEDGEIAALARARGGLIHCAGSNLFLGDGIAPIPKYLAAGVRVALGCDSGSANSRLSIFGEMRLAATLQKGLARSAGALTAAQVYAMGTAHGAHATGQAIGDLIEGCYADLVAIDLDDLSLQPAHVSTRPAAPDSGGAPFGFAQDRPFGFAQGERGERMQTEERITAEAEGGEGLLRNIVYAMEATAVRHVYVHGEAVVRDGRLVKQSERTIAGRVRALTDGWGREPAADAGDAGAARS